VKYQIDFSEDFGDPVVSPTNSILVIPTQDWFSEDPNAIVGFNPGNGMEEWRVPVLPENGTRQSITTRARFSRDGQTAYLHTAVLDDTNGPSFLYAIDATPGNRLGWHQPQ
jgi:hypothetical protein